MPIDYYKTTLQTIYEISMILNSSMNRHMAMSRVLNIMNDQLSMQQGMVLLRDTNKKKLEPIASIGIPDNLLPFISYKKNEGIVGKVFKLGVPILIPNIHEEPIFLNRLERKSNKKLSFLAVPIKNDNQTFGVLTVDKKISKLQNITSDMDILKMISTLLASFLQKVDLYENELKKLETDRNTAQAEKVILQKEVKTHYSFKGLVGNSKSMQQVFKKIRHVTTTQSTVLIRGESGTGKEVVAKTIHFNSERSKKPFIAVNCAAIPGELIESELFGYSKGAFTGADGEKKGKFELANGGTIFLDEVGDMPHEAQSKLLRVLQERTVEKLGSSKPVEINVRIIAATNKDLEKAVSDGDFRLDLYYRLNVINIHIPPLRKRKEDIPAIAKHLLKRYNKFYNKSFFFSDDIFSSFIQCSWPGNVREMENCIERAALEAENDKITTSHLTCVRGELCYAQLSRKTQCIQEPVLSEHFDLVSNKNNSDLSDKGRVIHALKQSGWVQAKAARMLGMTVRQINYRIKKYNIRLKTI